MGKKNVFAQIAKVKSQVQDIKNATSRPPETEKDIPTGVYCDTNGDIQTVDDICMVCIGNQWFYKAGTYALPTRGGYDRKKSRMGGDENGIPLSEYAPEPIYDADGCTIIGYKPKLYASGKFGYWETDEQYPMTENDKCESIYGDMAGKNVRLFKVPSTAKLPSFVSFKGGVPNLHDAGNAEDDDAFVFMTGLNISNIVLPTDTPKPLCKENPFTIYMAERTEANKTVVGTGMAISTFKGEIAKTEYAFPKIGVNSYEYFDREVNPGGDNNFRGGKNMEKPAYIIHSPDFNFRRPVLNPTRCLFEEEISGHGFRHGLYAKGAVPNAPTLPRENQKGARQSIVMNRSVLIGGDNKGKNKCVKAITYAPEHSIVNRDGKFTYSLMNLWKESSVYTEFEDKNNPGNNKPIPFLVDANGEYGGDYPLKDRTSDTSFSGDTIHHQRVIESARAHKVTFIRDLPRQYGSVISMVGIPFGLEGRDMEQTTISGLVGDSYMNPYTVKRTSYVSDKVPKEIAPLSMAMEILGIKSDLLGRILDPIFKVVGLQKIGDVPVSGASDPRNSQGGFRQGGAPIRNSDRYFPHLVKTNIWFWCNSDVNVDYRQVGSVENGEVHSRRLKSLMLDSSFPDGWNWKETFLNRFYAESNETPKWKIIARVLMNLIFTFGIGLSVLIKGVGDIVVAVAQIGGGTVGLQTVGAIVAFYVALLEVWFGIAWLIFWVASSIDNKAIDNMLGLDLVRPDVQNADGTFSMFDGRLRQAGETNYHRISSDIHTVNNLDIGFTMSDPYHVDKCDVYDNSIRYCDPQSQASSIDAWRNFKVNNLFTIPQDNGQVQKIFIMNDKVFAHTTDNIIMIEAGRSSMQTTTGSIYLGSGDLFGASEPLYGGVYEGFGGTKDPNAGVMTNAGYVFPDREARTWYIFTGSSVSRLGAKSKRQAQRAKCTGQNVSPLPMIQGGVEMFFENYGDFELLRSYPEFKNVDNKSRNGIGYSVGVDNSLDRILITKRDYRPLKPIADINNANLSNKELFCDVSYTISFDMETYDAISFHSYKPRVYAWNRHDLYSFEQNRMLLHNIRGKYLTFDCVKHPFVVEIVVAQNENFKYESTLLFTECFEWDGCQFLKRIKTFDKVMAYNDNQNSGEMTVVYAPKLDDIDNMTEKFEILPIDYNLKRWAFSGIFDKIKDPEKRMFTCECDPTVLIIDKNNYDKTLRDGEFRNDYMVMRLTSSNLKDNEKLILKSVATDTDYEIES